jgi:hypothetical protein
VSETVRLSKVQQEYLVSLSKNGRLTVDEVLADAKRKNSPLHDLYNWDMQKAAEEFWRERTREIIRTIKVVVTTQEYEFKAPCYVRDPDCENGEQGYIAVTALKRNPESARVELLAEFDRAAGVLRRAVNLAKVLGLEREVNGMLNSVVNLKAMIAGTAGKIESIERASAE